MKNKTKNLKIKWEKTLTEIRKSDQERDELIEQILIKTQIENKPHGFSKDELNKYEAWLLMQKDFILTNKLLF
jgi:hypothetical protein